MLLSKNINFARSFSIYRDKHYLDLYDAAKIILEGFNVVSISGGDRCTFEESKHFFSQKAVLVDIDETFYTLNQFHLLEMAMERFQSVN